MCYWLTLSVSILITSFSESKTLHDEAKHVGTIELLDEEPSPRDFYRKYMHDSKPVIIRPENPSWQKWKAQEIHELLAKHMGNVNGKAYRRPEWTSGWPIQEQVKFSKFLKEGAKKSMYWDSPMPMNNTFLNYVPYPYFMHCMEGSVNNVNLLYTFRNSSSVFHQDGYENVFLQLAGRKTWLIANHSFSKHAYADDYNTQAGLSPINPKDVDLTKYPLVSDMEFYKVTTEPGDILYVPQYWWHHVSSFDSPNIGLNLWMSVFNFPDLEDSFRVVEYVKKFAELRQNEPSRKDFCDKDLMLSMQNSKNVSSPHPIFFGSDDGTFNAMNSEGKFLWKYKTTGDAGSIPALSGDEETVYFAGEDAFLYSFEALSGKINWKFQLGDAVVAAVRMSADKKTLYVASLDSHVYAFTTFGKLLWKSESLEGELWASPLLTTSGLFVCAMARENQIKSYTVFRLNPSSGLVEWKYDAGGSVFASPATLNGGDMIFVSSYDANIHVLNEENGKLLWKFPLGEQTDSSPFVNTHKKELFATTITGELICLDIQSRKVKWKRTFQAESDVLSSPSLISNVGLLYQAIDKRLYSLNATNGDKVWVFEAKDTFTSTPRADANGVVYIGNNDKNIYAINATTGVLIWSYETNGPVIGSVTMGDAKIHKALQGGLL